MDAYLSPEMKSTGEAIGYDKKLHRAVYKAMIASGMTLRNYGTVLVSVADEDKIETIPLVRRFYEMGFNIEATTLTAEYLLEAGIKTRILHKPSEHSEEMLDSIRAGYVSYVINTRAVLSGVHYGDGVALRGIAAQNNVVTLTSLDTVPHAARCFGRSHNGNFDDRRGIMRKTTSGVVCTSRADDLWGGLHPCEQTTSGVVLYQFYVLSLYSRR